MTLSPSLIPELLSTYLYYRLAAGSRLSRTSTYLYYRLYLSLPSTRLYPHHLCSEPMDLKYYSIRRLGMSQEGERVGLMIDG